MKFYKVKAGSLQFAIMISAIIAILLSVFMVLIHSHLMFAKKSDVLIETIQQSENLVLAQSLIKNYPGKFSNSVPPATLSKRIQSAMQCHNDTPYIQGILSAIQNLQNKTSGAPN